jgi:branched-chain amino acid transport system permease protein
VGLIWLAVLVSIGSRSIIAALVAGLAFSLLPGVFSTYLSHDLAEIPVILFGLGAVMLAKNPEGVIAMHGRQLHDHLVRRAQRRHGPPGDDGPDSIGTSNDVPSKDGAHQVTAGGVA